MGFGFGCFVLKCKRMFRLANFLKEGKLKKEGYKNIAGVDEVGIGAFAGPIFAAAVILPIKFKAKIRDSKHVSWKKRERLAKIIKKKSEFGLGWVEKEEIDKLGLTAAKKMAVHRALRNLSPKPDFVLLDGLDFLKKLDVPYQFIIKGDEKIRSIAAASLVAKVERDKVMRELAKKYPLYHFEKNKGYGTNAHMIALSRYGPCPAHRRSYQPIKKLKTNRPSDNVIT